MLFILMQQDKEQLLKGSNHVILSDLDMLQNTSDLNKPSLTTSLFFATFTRCLSDSCKVDISHVPGYMIHQCSAPSFEGPFDGKCAKISCASM